MPSAVVAAVEAGVDKVKGSDGAPGEVSSGEVVLEPPGINPDEATDEQREHM